MVSFSVFFVTDIIMDRRFASLSLQKLCKKGARNCNETDKRAPFLFLEKCSTTDAAVFQRCNTTEESALFFSKIYLKA